MTKDMIVINNIKKRIKEQQKKLQAQSISKVYIRDVQRHIEARTGVKWQNIDQIYKGYSNGSVEVALKLANYFGCTVEDLYTLEQEKNNIKAC